MSIKLLTICVLCLFASLLSKGDEVSCSNSGLENIISSKNILSHSFNYFQLSDKSNHSSNNNSLPKEKGSTPTIQPENKQPLLALASNNGPVCVSDTLKLFGQGGTSYSWLGPGGWTSNLQNPVRPGVLANMAGVYTLFVSVNGIPDDTAYTTVVVHGLLSGTLSGSTTICSGQSTTLIINVSGNGLVNGMLSDGTLFSGFPPLITLTVSPLATTLYTIVALSDPYCTANASNISGSAQVDVEPERPVSITISALENPVCPGSPVKLLALPVNEGTSPFYQWKVNNVPAGSNSPSLTYMPTNGDVVTCVLTSNNAICSTGSPATSNAIVVNVGNNLQAANVISASQNNICLGTTVNFTSNPANGGISPAFQWKVNALNVGVNSPSFSYQPANGDIVTCVLTSSMGCVTGNPATSNSLVMSVNAMQPVSIAIAADQTTLCPGTVVNLNAWVVNGGTAPQYQWKVNGVNAGSNSSSYSYLPADGDAITCIVTSNALCTTGNPATSDHIMLSVSPWLPVSISISASNNNVCQGTNVTYNATIVNAGTAPVFQWMVNGIASGLNSAVFVYAPAPGDIISCSVTSNYMCATGNPAVSNSIAMNVFPVMTAGVTISENFNNVCAGTSVTFTATPANGGTAPAFQWKVNGVNAGTNSPVYTFTPANGNIVSCVLTSNLGCVSGNPAISNSVSMIVSPVLPLSVTISEGQNNVCAGTLVTFAATPFNAGAFPAFQWKVNGVNAGLNQPAFSYTPANGDVVTCALISSAQCISGNPATSNAVVMTVNSALVAGISVTASNNNVCQGTMVNFTANPLNPGSSPVYQWRVNGIDAGINQPAFAYIPSIGDEVTCLLFSSLSCATGSPATSAPVIMTVYPMLTATVSISASSTNVCAGTLTNFTASVTNGGTSPVFQWKVNGINVGTNNSIFSYIPQNGDIITCTLTSNALCLSNATVTSNSVVMTVNALLPVSISISANQNNICSGTTVLYTATPANGSSTPVYQWKVNGLNTGANSPTFSYVPLNGDLVTCTLSSGFACTTNNPAVSNTITMAVFSSLPVSITIAPDNNIVCQGNTVSFSSFVTNGGANPVYQWTVNGINSGTNSPVFSYVPVNGDVVLCLVTSNLSCANGVQVSSNTVSITVNAFMAASVSISASQTLVCQGTFINFTANAVNGGASPAYQWKVNGINVGSNLAFFSYTPANGDVVSCVLTSGLICAINNPATSNIISITVNPSIPVAISIAASQLSTCPGVTVTYTATPTNGGSSPVYQWKVNGVNVGINATTYSYIPLNGDVITCSLTSDVLCATNNPATSNSITMNVSNSLPVSVIISSNPVNACAGLPVTYTAAPTNGGSAAAYQWTVNGINAGSNSAVYTYTPSNGDLINCSLNSSALCATGNPASSNTINVIVYPNSPVSVSIAANQNNVCSGTTVTYTATPINGGTTPAYQWRVNGINAGINSPTHSYTPVNGDKIVCRVTSNIPCPVGSPALSNEITMLVNPLLPASITITADQNNICMGSSVIFTATAVNGGTTPAYQWQVNGINVGTNSNVFTYIPANSDLVTCILTSNALCASGSPATSGSITMNVSATLPAGVTIVPNNTTICAGSTATFSASPVNGGMSPAYQWQVNGIAAGSNNSNFSYIPVDGDVVTCIVSSSLSCASGNPVTSNPVVLNVDPLLNVAISIVPGANNVCQGTAVTFTATAVNGGISPIYQWKRNGINTGINSAVFTFNPLNGDVISCEVISDEGCSNNNPATSNQVLMAVNPNMPVSAVISADQNNVCQGTNITFTAVATNGGTAPAYQWQVNGINSGANNASFSYTPNNGDLVRCILTSNAACTVANPVNSNSITAIVIAILPASVTISCDKNNVCQGTAVNFIATASNGGLAPAFEWVVNGISTGITSTTFTFFPNHNDIISCTLNSSLTCVSANPASSNTLFMSVLPLLPANVLITADDTIICAGTNVNLTAFPVNGGSNPVYEWNVNGIITGSNQATFSYTPLDHDLVTCTLTSNDLCAVNNPTISNIVHLTVCPLLPASITIQASKNNFCQGTDVEYTAFPVNGGANPVYQWSVNGMNTGTNQNTFNYIPSNNDIVRCSMISDTVCATGNPAVSNAIVMKVVPSYPVSIFINVNQNSICEGAQALFTGTALNGGTSPVFQWTVNGTASGINSAAFSYIPANGDVVACSVTANNAVCPIGSPASSNTITMIVDPVLPAGISIVENNNNVCQGTVVSFNATPTNGGSTPLYEWRVNGLMSGSNSPVFSYIPVQGDIVQCLITSGLNCVTGSPALSNAVTMTVFPNLPVSITINSTMNNICQGDTVIFNAVATNGGTAPAYLWQVNGTNAGLNLPSFVLVPVNGDVITCILTSDEICTAGNPATSNAVSMTVNPITPVNISITEDQNNVCESTSVTFTSVVTNGGTSPIYQWKVNNQQAGNGQASYVYVPQNGDEVSCSLVSSALCPSVSPAISNTVLMSVNILNIYDVGSISGGYYCEGGQGVEILLSGSQTGNLYDVLLNNLNTGVTLAGTGSALNFGPFSTPGHYSVQAWDAGRICTAMMRDTINVIMNPTPVTDFTTNTACAGDTTYFTLTGSYIQQTSSWSLDFRRWHLCYLQCTFQSETCISDFWNLQCYLKRSRYQRLPVYRNPSGGSTSASYCFFQFYYA